VRCCRRSCRVALARDAAQFGDAADVDQRLGRGQAQLQQRHETVAAGQKLGARVCRQELMHVGHRAGAVVVEVRGKHGYAPFLARATARHTRSGVSGICSDSTPNGRKASITALYTVAVDAIVPASPIPLTPSG
jgi:hypothetical protein